MESLLGLIKSLFNLGMSIAPVRDMLYEINEAVDSRVLLRSGAVADKLQASAYLSSQMCLKHLISIGLTLGLRPLDRPM